MVTESLRSTACKRVIPVVRTRGTAQRFALHGSLPAATKGVIVAIHATKLLESGGVWSMVARNGEQG